MARRRWPTRCWRGSGAGRGTVCASLTLAAGAVHGWRRLLRRNDIGQRVDPDADLGFDRLILGRRWRFARWSGEGRAVLSGAVWGNGALSADGGDSVGAPALTRSTGIAMSVVGARPGAGRPNIRSSATRIWRTTDPASPKAALRSPTCRSRPWDAGDSSPQATEFWTTSSIKPPPRIRLPAVRSVRAVGPERNPGRVTLP